MTGTVITLQELINLRKQALHQPQIILKKKMFLSGEKLTHIRGRGIEFDITREYQAGDDIRSMAWRVTARSLKPHIKVYCEEKERPVWLAIDLSSSMYFGTRCMFKSVKSIMQAVLTGWSCLLKREQIGTMISIEQKTQLFKPKSDEKNYLAILNSLAECSCLQPAFNEHHNLNSLLLSLQQHTRFGNLIHIYSDFQHLDRDTEKLILYLAQRTQVILNFVYDPLEAAPPLPDKYILTNGQQKMLFDMQDAYNRAAYKELFQKKVQSLKAMARKHQIVLHMHCTAAAGIN